MNIRQAKKIWKRIADRRYRFDTRTRAMRKVSFYMMRYAHRNGDELAHRRTVKSAMEELTTNIMRRLLTARGELGMDAPPYGTGL